MSTLSINPDAFNHKGCDCPHCFCSCNDCTGGREWIKVGDTLLSDRALIMPVAAFDPAPQSVRRVPLPDRLADLLNADYSDQPSAEWFDTRYLEVLEALGYKVRPLAAATEASGRSARTHGVLREGVVVGLLMPVNEPTEGSRKAA